MKKVLLTVSALGLALALTATVAAAEVSFKASGKYNLTGMYLNNGGSSSNGMEAGIIGDVENNDMWHQSMYVYPTLTVNDNISMQGEMRFLDRDVYTSTSQDDRLRVYKLWMNYVSPIGTISMGRMPGGQYGSAFLDSTYAADRIKLSTSINDEVGLVFVYQKALESDAYDYDENAEDTAQYLAGVNLSGDIGKTSVAVWHTIADEDGGDYINTELWFNGVYTLGGFNVAAEAKYIMGEDSDQEDIASAALMLDVSTKLDSVTAGVLFFYGQGDMDDDDTNNGYVTKSGVGNNYNPFAIATGDYMGLLNGGKNSYLGAFNWIGLDPTDNVGQGSNPGFIALALYGVMPVSDKMTVNAAIGHIWADDAADYNNEMGWEVDFGMAYKLLDNLTYSATLGFLNPGKMVEDIADDMGSGRDVNNIMLLMHSLTMTF